MLADLAATPSCIAAKQWAANAVKRDGLMFSGRFDGDIMEDTIRRVADRVKSKSKGIIKVLIVDAQNTAANYGLLTMQFLEQMDCMVPFVFHNYGEDTGNPYCTFKEVQYCVNHPEVRCLPLKLYSSKHWPPAPCPNSRVQNGYYFVRDMLYAEFPVHDEAELKSNLEPMTDYIIKSYLKFHPELRERMTAAPMGNALPMPKQPPKAAIITVPKPGLAAGRLGPPAKPAAAVAEQGVPASDHPGFEVGQTVNYLSTTHGTQILTQVLKNFGDGTYEIDVKPGAVVSGARLTPS